MPAKVIWSPSSLDDLEAAIAHIAADNPAAALRFGSACLEQGARLATFPRLGRLFLAGPHDEIREVRVAPYRMFYRIASDGSTVMILRVWHSARDEPSLL